MIYDFYFGNQIFQITENSLINYFQNSGISGKVKISKILYHNHECTDRYKINVIHNDKELYPRNIGIFKYRFTEKK